MDSSSMDSWTPSDAPEAMICSWAPRDAPEIFAAVSADRWDMVDRLLQDATHRKHLDYADSLGYTALHHVSWNKTVPLNVVKSIVSYSPKNAFCKKTISQGRTPLHFAAYSGRDDVTCLLVSACPIAASILDQCGKSPLCDACTQNRSADVLKALIDVDRTQLSVRNHWGRTPGETFFRNWHGWLCDSTHSNSCVVETQRREFITNARVILEAEYRSRHGTDAKIDDHRILEIAIASPCCPISCVRILLETYSNEIGLSREGSTLLHFALSAIKDDDANLFYKCDSCKQVPMQIDTEGADSRILFPKDPTLHHWGVLCETCSLARAKASPGLSFVKYTKVPIVDKGTAAIDAILSHCPSLTGMSDSLGRKPLALALQQKRRWATEIKPILEANRTVLRVKDPVTKLYPFMLAAVKEECNKNLRPSKKYKPDVDNTGDSSEQLTMIFSLLMDDPSVLTFRG